MDLFEDDFADVAAELSRRSPLEFPWGYMARGDAPGGAGGGGGAFLWFSSDDEMLRFFTEREIEQHWFEEADEHEQGTYLGRVRRFLLTLDANGQNREAVLHQINETLESTVTLDWWGTFADLCNSTEPVAGRWREEFREVPEFSSEYFSRPLEEEEIPRFITFLAEFAQG